MMDPATAAVAAGIVTCSGVATACCGAKAKQAGELLRRAFRPTPAGEDADLLARLEAAEAGRAAGDVDAGDPSAGDRGDRRGVEAVD